MAVTVTDVENTMGAAQYQSLESAVKTELLDQARRLKENVFDGRVATNAEIEGDGDDFIKNLAAHKWLQAQGGETSSEGQTGGNVTYNLPAGLNEDDLSSTRYGRVCLGMLRQRANIGVVRNN